MEGHGFLKHFSGDLSIVNGNCEIHKVDRVASFHEYPFEAMIIVDCGLKVVPAIIVDGWVWMRNPDSKDIINEAVMSY